MNNQVFTKVNYRQFRQFMASINATGIKGKGYETSIYNKQGDIKAIVHAASIDEHGRCHPAQYYIRTIAMTDQLSYAA